MRFSAEQRFEAPLDDVLALFTDPDFYGTLTGLPKISTPEVVDHSADAASVHLRLHQRYTGDLPRAALTFIDPVKLSWIEELAFDVTRATATTRLVPDHYGDRFTCSGHYVFLADGARATIRRVDGDLRVKVPLVGGKVEGALVSGLREHAAAEQELVAGRLGSR
jgi:hypothetical protein